MSVAQSTKIEWVIFDLGAVLIDWNPRYAFRRMHRELGLDPTLVEERVEIFLRDVATSEWNSQMDAGTLFQNAIDERAKQFPEWRAWLQMWRDEWPTMMRGLVPGMQELFADVLNQRSASKLNSNVLAREKSAGLKGVFALSNWEANTFKIARARFPFLDHFDGRLISGEERLIKPDPAFFKLLESRYGVDPGRAIFIDDLPKNTRVAESLGYQVHVFEFAESLRADLEMRKIL